LSKPTICQIEITYIPQRGKGPKAREAIEDALERLFIEALPESCEGAESTVRYVQEAK
jgi:hypothetical protein